MKTGDSIYIPEKDRLWIDETSTTTVRILGAINKPGRYRFIDDMTLIDLIAQAAGTKGDAYIEKITIVNLSCCKNQAQSFDLLAFSKTADVTKLPCLGLAIQYIYRIVSKVRFKKWRQGLSDVFQFASIAALLGLI